MTLRWRYGTNAWEAMYYIGGGLSFGMSSPLFIALCAAAPEDQQGAAIGLYYLSQQLGMIFGTGGFSTLQEIVFYNALSSALRNFPSRNEVGLALETMLQSLFSSRESDSLDTDKKLVRS